MSDIDNPFCPLPKERLLFNVENDKHKIEKIIEYLLGIVNQFMGIIFFSEKFNS